MPDTFDNHAEVVATGRLDGDTLYIDADGIMAKCPSKYEERPTVAGDYVSGAGMRQQLNRVGTRPDRR